MNTHGLWLITAFVAALADGNALRAQSCAARNTFRIANSHSGLGSEINVDTGWTMALPLITPGSNAHSVGTCQSQAVCYVESAQGTMRITASGTGTNCATSGVVLLLDQAPQATVNDTFTIVSATLPHGTPVQVRLDLALDGFATIEDAAPQRDFRAQLYCSSSSLLVANGSGSQSTTFTAYVGSQYLLSARLNLHLNCQSLGGLGIPPRTSSFAADLVATFAIECLTPGAAINSCFGQPYRPFAARSTTLAGGCGAGSPTWAGTLPVLGAQQTWTLQGAAPQQPAFVVAAFSQPVPTPFGSCVVLVDLPASMTLAMGTTSSGGTASFGLLLPADPSFTGLRLTTQPLVMQPGGPLLGIAQVGNAVLSTLGL